MMQGGCKCFDRSSNVTNCRSHAAADGSASATKVDPCVIVIFCALGDSTKRNLVPALFHLACSDCMSGQFKVLGSATIINGARWRTAPADVIRKEV
jgi:hypothetical protein